MILVLVKRGKKRLLTVDPGDGIVCRSNAVVHGERC